MGRTHSFMIVRILALLYGRSEAGIHLNKFFFYMLQLGRGVKV